MVRIWERFFVTRPSFRVDERAAIGAAFPAGRRDDRFVFRHIRMILSRIAFASDQIDWRLREEIDETAVRARKRSRELIDSDGKLRDLSEEVPDISPELLSRDSLDRLRAL